ncbi:MAG: hypothetical protein QOF17_1114 [Solirubrobacteraceae bacterium]|nr:hypothetical protein [Solirubrobacteraceae bacterium]
MRRAVLLASAALLLAGPVPVALAGGGYGDRARILAGVAAWLLAGVAAIVVPRPLPRTSAGRIALGGLAALAALTLASVTWAPLKAPAYADAQRVALYLGVFAAAIALLPAAGVSALVEPALAACAAVVVGYGLSERLVPALVTLHRSVAAGGRLDQPLGYWNAMGGVAAVGLVLAAGLAGDPGRGVRARSLAAAAAPLLGAGVALSFSRGALLAAAAGAGVTLLARPARPQVRATVLSLVAAAAAGVLAASLPAVTDLAGARDLQGAVLAAALLAGGAAAALAQAALARREAAGALSSGTLPATVRRAVAAAVAVGVVAAAVLLLAGEGGPRSGTPAFGADASRLASVQSSRYDYWRAAVDTWADHPVAGVGASGFAVEWLRRRTVREAAHDAHSLPLETAAELGLLGLAALALLAGGVAAAARRVAWPLAGAAGGLAAWSAHAAIDWAWELPGDALFGVLLAAALVAVSETAGARGRPPAPAPPPRRPPAPPGP